MNILVVDDVPAIVELVCVSLRRGGHTTVAAHCVDDARRALTADGPFDLVLTDMQMPAGTGVDVLRACVGGESPAPAMLVMTGQASARQIAEAFALGARAVLKKPFCKRQLLDAVTSAARPPVPAGAMA